MRRQVMILLSTLLLTSPVLAQEWPASFIGDQIHFQEEREIQMHLEHVQDGFLWPVIDMSGMFFYFGSLGFDYCFGENVAFFMVNKMAQRHCNDEECFYSSPRPISNVYYQLSWNEDAKAYLVISEARWGSAVVALTLDLSSESSVMRFGAMNISELNVVEWDSSYAQYTYKVEPFTVQRTQSMLRRPSGRRGVK